MDISVKYNISKGYLFENDGKIYGVKKPFIKL